jgi:hypothetical protein
MSQSRDDPRHSWLERLVEEVGRAVQTGNAQTARWIAVLAVAAAALSTGTSAITTWSTAKAERTRSSET